MRRHNSRVNPHKFDTTILREYDIRGVVGDTLSVSDAYAIGRAFGSAVYRGGGGAVPARGGG